MAFKTIALITNVSKKDAASQTPKLAEWLQQKNIQVKLAAEDAAQLKCDGVACEKDELIAGTDLIITLGGDGTVLRAVNLLQGARVPVLAVNYGKFGFLQEVAPKNLYSDLEQVLAGKYKVEERNLLEVRFNNQKHLVLNDLVLSHDGFRIMQLKTYVNGTFFYEYPADGLAIANPTGATAYSLSAGGPLVDPHAKVNILTPINPHSLLNRSIVLDDKDIIDIKVASINGSFKVSGDGLNLHYGKPLDVRVTGSEEKAMLIKLRPGDFFGFLRSKLQMLSGVNGAD